LEEAPLPRSLPRLVIPVALAAALASPAAANGSLLHAGMFDPTTEGFAKTLSGTDPGSAPGNDGLDYWEIDKSDAGTSQLSYFVGQADLTLAAILSAPEGWVLTATARVLEATAGGGPGFPTVSVSDSNTGGLAGGDAWYFALVLNTGNPSQSTLSYLTNTSQLATLTTLDVSEYHDYEFSLDPGADMGGFDDAVEVRVDGTLVGTLARSQIPDQGLSPSLRFGDSSAGRSLSRWARVELIAVPEPGQPLLLLVAAAALRFARAGRGR
jgi:hypothetical protein